MRDLWAAWAAHKSLYAAPRTGSDGRVDPIPQTISFSEVGPELDNVDNSHWLPTDVNADGKMDLIYLDYRANRRCTEQVNSDEVITKHCVPGDFSESGLRTYTLMSNGDGSWEPRYDFLQGLGYEDFGRWMSADVNGDGKADLVYTDLYSERGPLPSSRHAAHRRSGQYAPLERQRQVDQIIARRLARLPVS